MRRLTDLKEVKVKGKLKGLRPVLDNWCEAALDYARCSRYEDCCWWYNERASLSVLAGAAWRTPGWVALEEFSTRKRGVVPEGEIDHGKTVRGRCDLRLENSYSTYALEAKQAWQSVGPKSTSNKVGKAMGLAWRDAGNLTNNEADSRIAVVFASLFFPMSELKRRSRKMQNGAAFDELEARKLVGGWLEANDISEYDAYSYVIPRSCGKLISSNGRLVFAATMLCMRLRKKGNKQRRK